MQRDAGGDDAAHLAQVVGRFLRVGGKDVAAGQPALGHDVVDV